MDKISLSEAIKSLQQSNPTKNIHNEVVIATLKGEFNLLEFPFMKFYNRCINQYNDGDSTHPLNWLSISKHGIKELKNAPGVKNMEKEFAKGLINRSYKFIIVEALLTDKQEEEKNIKKQSDLIFIGILRFNRAKNYFYFSTTDNQKILMKFCWILGAIND